MSETKVGCLKSTLIGCGLALLVAIAVPVILAVMVVQPLNRAVKDRQVIEQRFGEQAEFVPPPSGVPDADRIEAFLHIQTALVEVCADIKQAEASVAAMEALDDQDEISRIEAMRMAMRTTRNMMGMGPAIGTLYEVRNRELLGREMGLGEYTYIFATAYNEQLSSPASDFQLFGPGPVNPRIREALRSMLRNQYEAVRAAASNDERLASLAAELEALEADDTRLIWQDGLPDDLAAAYAPQRSRLDELYCAAAAPLQLMINEKRGLAIESN